jgi:hypothetical protein
VVADGVAPFTGTVTTRDANGLAVPGAPVSFQLPAGVSIKSPSASHVSDASGKLVVELVSQTAGSYVVNALVGGAKTPAVDQVVRFKAGPVDLAETFLTAPSGHKLADGRQEQVVAATVLDAQRNPVPEAWVRFTAPPVARAAGPLLAQVDANGQASVALTSVKAGVYEVTAEVAPAQSGPWTAITVGSPAKVEFRAGPVDPAKSVMTAAPSGPLTADGVAAYQVKVALFDAQGNPVEVAGNQARLQFRLFDWGGSPVAGVAPVERSLATDASGVAETEFASVKAGVWRAWGSSAGAEVSNSPLDLAFDPLAPSAGSSLFDVTVDNVLANGADKHSAWVLAKDVHGNPAKPGQEVQFGVEPGAPSLPGPVLSPADGKVETCDYWAVDKPAWCDQPGKALVEITSNEPGSFQVSAVIGADAVQDSPKPVSFNAAAPDPSKSSYALTPDTAADPSASLTADGSAKYSLTVSVKDSFGTGVPAVPVRLTGLSPKVSATPAGLEGVTGGTASSNYATHTWELSATQAGAFTGVVQIQVGADWVDLSPSPFTLRFAAGQVDPVATSASFATWDGPVLNNLVDESWARVVVQDRFGNGVGGLAVAFALPLSQSGALGTPVFVDGQTPPTAKSVTVVTCGYDLDPVPERCLLDGVYTPGLAYAPVVSEFEGVFNVSASVDGGALGPVAVGPKPVVFEAGAGSAAASWFELARTDPMSPVVRADGVASYKLSVTVMNGLSGASSRPVAGECVAPSLPAEVSVKAPGPAVGPCPAGSFATGADGRVVVELVSKRAGSWQVGARLGGSPVASEPGGSVLSLSALFAGGLPSVVNSELTSPAAPVRADDPAGQVVVAKVLDEFGNAASCLAGSAPTPCLVHFRVPAGTWVGEGVSRVDGPGVVLVAAAVPDYSDPSGPGAGAGEARVRYRGAEGAYPVTAQISLAAPHGSSELRHIQRADGVWVEGAPAAARVVFTDSTAPAPPLVDLSDGRQVTGQVAPEDKADAVNGDLVVVVRDRADGSVLCEARVGVDGSFKCDFRPPLADGREIVVVVVDPAGNQSDGKPAVVDAVAPAPPRPSPSDGKSLSGVGDDPGNKIVVRDRAGNVVCETVVGPDRTWVCQLVPPAQVGDVLDVVESDPVGNRVLKPWRVGLPEVALAKPRLHRNDPQSATGVNFQPGETVVAVTAGAGSEAAGADAPALAAGGESQVGQATADGDGRVVFRWRIPLDAARGEHVLTLRGAASGNVTGKFTVLELPAPQDVAPPPVATRPGLPVTGADDVVGLAGAALGLLLSGLLLALAASRRRDVHGKTP